MKFWKTLVLVLLGAGVAAADPARELAQSVAEAHGLKRWPEVRAIQFTSHAQLPDRTVKRTWIWHPPTREVIQYGNDGPALSWKRDELADASGDVKGADAMFINDIYWLLFPFHMIWDTACTLTLHEGDHPLPIGSGVGRKLTVTYTGAEGYTPGDAYDVFVGGDNRIAAWIYRKGNAPTPTRMSTWEDYREVGGLVLAHDHRGPDGFRVWFTDVRVETSAGSGP